MANSRGRSRCVRVFGLAGALIVAGADDAPKCHLPGVDLALKEEVYLGQSEEVARLLRCRADVETRTVQGLTPLALSAYSGHKRVASMLLDHRADLEAVSVRGATPLAVASFWGHSPVVELLADSRAQLEVRTRQGLTPLAEAAHAGHVDVVESLLQRRAKSLTMDRVGKTPLMFAAHRKRVGVVALLGQRCGGSSGGNFGSPDTDDCSLHARDSFGLLARDWGILGDAPAPLLDLLPEPPESVVAARLARNPTFWGSVLLCVGVVATAWWADHLFPSRGNVYLRIPAATPASASRTGNAYGARMELLAAKASWRERDLHVAWAYRLLGVVANGVGGIQLVRCLDQWSCLFLLAALYVLPACIAWRGELLGTPAFMLASPGSSLKSPGKWSATTAVGCVLSVGRLILFYAIVIYVTHREGFSVSDVDEFNDLVGVAYRYPTPEAVGRGKALPVYPCAALTRFWRVFHQGDVAVTAVWMLASLGLAAFWCLVRCFRSRRAVQVAIAPNGNEAFAGQLAAQPLPAVRTQRAKRFLRCDVAWFAVDLALDLGSMAILHRREYVRCAGLLLGVIAWSLARALRCSGLGTDFSQTARNGFPADSFLDFLDRERGQKAFVSLLVCTYALPVAARTPFQTVVGSLSIATSAAAVASRLSEAIDLADDFGFEPHPEEVGGGAI